MNYRHIYHAGCFADVFKHSILCALLSSLLKKEKPFSVLDTHAGIGLYDLSWAPAQKTKEYKEGILKLLSLKNIPPALETYVNIVKTVNSGDEQTMLRYYPGSPVLIKSFLRQVDTLDLCELHPDDFQTLKSYFLSDNNIHVHHRDAYQSLKALLPLPYKRGLILIDPAFEQKNEFNSIIAAVKEGLKRFSHGIFAIWFPIKDKHLVNQFYADLALLPIERKLSLSLFLQTHLTNATASALGACGMIIINPPWQFEKTAEEILSFLKVLYQEDKTAYNIHSLP